MTDQSWRDGIKVHPAADLFPMMSNNELDELAADIMEHGIQQPIVWLKGQLLDGRTRVAAVHRIPDEKRREAIIKRCQNGKDCILHAFMEDPQPTSSAPISTAATSLASKKRVIVAELLKANPARSDNATAKIANLRIREWQQSKREFHEIKTTGGS